MRKISKKEKMIILIAMTLIIVIIGIIIGANAIKVNIANGKYNSANNDSSNGNLLPEYIKAGITLGGVTGTLEDLDTSDATATPEDITYGKTAYVNGVKITGTYLENLNDIVDGVPIPKGFYYVGGEKSTGVVISDNIEDENKYSSENWESQEEIPSGNKIETGINGTIEKIIGNQFVWVPVEDFSLFNTYPGYYDGKLDTDFFPNCEEPAPEGKGYATETEEYNAMRDSVEKYKGFYVARFEAGNENKIAVSKPGISPWNNIAWGSSNTNIGKNGAVYRAQNMYTDTNTFKVTSTLIYGVQWDAIMTWIDSNYPTGNCQSGSIVVKSNGHGRYNSDSIVNCGSNDKYRVKNIYDLGGNVAEWTMELDISTKIRINRGGDYNDPPATYPLSNRNEDYTINGTSEDVGFRVALYL